MGRERNVGQGVGEEVNMFKLYYDILKELIKIFNYKENYNQPRVHEMLCGSSLKETFYFQTIMCHVHLVLQVHHYFQF